MNWLRKALEESPGVPSSIRLQMLIVCVMTAILPLTVWAVLSIKLGAMADIPGGVVALCSLLFGGAVMGKVVQQRSE